MGQLFVVSPETLVRRMSMIDALLKDSVTLAPGIELIIDRCNCVKWEFK